MSIGIQHIPTSIIRVINTISNNKIVEYVADGVDNDLKRSLPIGTNLDKKKGNLDYTVDGEVIDDFPIWFYLVIGGIGFCMFCGYILTILFGWLLTKNKIKKSPISLKD